MYLQNTLKLKLLPIFVMIIATTMNDGDGILLFLFKLKKCGGKTH
jgi:hypothetical protein